jgi:hypothetical protein
VSKLNTKHHENIQRIIHHRTQYKVYLRSPYSILGGSRTLQHHKKKWYIYYKILLVSKKVCLNTMTSFHGTFSFTSFTKPKKKSVQYTFSLFLMTPLNSMCFLPRLFELQKQDIEKLINPLFKFNLCSNPPSK